MKVSGLMAAALLVPPMFSQSFVQPSEVSIRTPPPVPVVGHLLAPFHFEKRVVALPRLDNTPRLESLVRGGNLYLSVQDVIALVLENNLDIAVQRYSPLLAREVLRRTQGGAILRNVESPLLPGPVSVSTAGVNTNANGMAAGGAALGTGGGIVTQVGPAPPSLDPTLTVQAQVAHFTTPETNLLLDQTTALTNSYRYLAVQYSQQWATGTGAQITFFDSRTFENTPTNLLNPYLSGDFDVYLTQNLLQGFSPAVNTRDIRVARNNLKGSRLQVELQVATTVAAVLNLYWDLVSFNDAVHIKQGAVETAQKLYDGNVKEKEIGALAGIEVTRAAAGVSAAKEELLLAQTNLAQQEIVLKNALSRNGIESSWLDEVHIVPLDHIVVPAEEPIRPLQDLMQEALSNRLEIERSKVDIESRKIMIRGDRNALIPNLQAFTEFTNNALAGPANPLYNNCCGAPNDFFVGGNGNVIGQLFRRNFPSYSAGFSLNIPFRNRVQQADYVTDQLELRQAELEQRRALNQVRVDVKTAVIGLQQARARYETAVDARRLGEETLAAEQKRFQAGAGTVATVMQAQKDLSADEDAEVQAMANYTHARIFFDQAMGRTLEVNHITVDEAVSGNVQRISSIPESIR